MKWWDPATTTIVPYFSISKKYQPVQQHIFYIPFSIVSISLSCPFSYYLVAFIGGNFLYKLVHILKSTVEAHKSPRDRKGKPPEILAWKWNTSFGENWGLHLQQGWVYFWLYDEELFHVEEDTLLGGNWQKDLWKVDYIGHFQLVMVWENLLGNFLIMYRFSGRKFPHADSAL